MMVQTILEISTDRLNWSMIAVRSGIASYEAMLFQARDVLAYYVDYFPDARIYTRVTYSPTSKSLLPDGLYSAREVRGKLPELNAQDAIEAAERILKQTRG